MRYLFLSVLLISACSSTRHGLVTTYLINGKHIPLSNGSLLTKSGALELQKKRIAGIAISDVDAPIILLHGTLPRYPVKLGSKKIEGGVEISFIIDEKGSVRHPKIVSSTHQILTNICIISVSKWRFQPIKKAGFPVQVQAIQKLSFKIMR